VEPELANASTLDRWGKTVKKIAGPKPTPKKPDQKPRFALFPANVTAKELLNKLGIVPKK
jgi:hypothetical protein